MVDSAKRVSRCRGLSGFTLSVVSASFAFANIWDTPVSIVNALPLLLLQPFAPCRRLLWPLLTSRSVLPRRPFSHEARSPQVRTRSFSTQPPDLRRLSLDHKSFAQRCPLALLGTASYRVLVHRLAVSLHASFPHSVTLMQLRFASFAVTNLREDFHLQDRAHAGRTTKSPYGTRSLASFSAM